MTLLPSETRTAQFSPCRTYRYSLRIVWDESLPVAVFIGLNPSTADEVQDDPTIRRCKAFAASWGCGGMVMLNLFAYRATDPKVMKAYPFPVGGDNKLDVLMRGCDGPRVACWGTHGAHFDLGEHTRESIPGLQCLGKNQDGSPKHPLYLRADTRLESFGKSCTPNPERNT